jgi:hypothetical protein
MSIQNLTGDGRAAPTIPPPPPPVPASVSISAPTGFVVPGVPVAVHVGTNPGVRWVWIPGDQTYEDRPAVTFVNTFITRDNTEVITGGTVTFLTQGDHTLFATGVTSTGEQIKSPTITVHVAGPPTFTLLTPAEGTVVDLNDGGGSVTVHLTATGAQLFPMQVSTTVDGRTTTDTLNGADYTRTIPLAPMPLASRPISVTCLNAVGLAGTQTRNLIGRDIGAPTVRPAQDAFSVLGDAAGTAIAPLSGTAADTHTGMSGGKAGVSWALTPTGTRTVARPSPTTGFADWTADVPLAGFGVHTIYLWATDQAGNTMPAPTTVAVTVISSFTPTTLDERLSERQYLASLLSFAQEQVTLPGDPRPQLDTATLVAALGQPVDRLSQPLSPAADRGGQEINQLRVPVEVLRAHIAATHAATTPGAALETTYRETAYASLLSAYGTSYAQLRLTRGAAPADRQAVAARLGIRLTAKLPDELDQLILDGSKLTETVLETLFGLPSSTAADPVRTPVPPLLLTWRLAALALTWAEQDQHPDLARDFAVLADPDLIGAADVTAGRPGDPVRALLTQRAGQLKSYSNSLEQAKPAGATPAAALAAMLAFALPGVDLADLAAKDQQGTDIVAPLAAAGLSRAGFLYLRELGRIAAAGPVTTAEWADANAVLVAARKTTLYPTWRAQETAFVLSPDYFVLTDVAPVVNAYRSGAAARASWQSVLRTRIAQRQSLVDAAARAVAAAEQVALPILRDALLADLAPTAAGEVGEEMSARFFVDTLAGGTLRTTRIRQAIESVQSLLFAKRSGELLPTHPVAAWAIKELDVFTAAWVWMGELGSWRAATTAFLFPERNLDPTQLVPGSAAPLDAFFTRTRGSGPFSAAQAREEADHYLRDKLGTAFTYLSPSRSAAHQKELRDRSKATAEPAAREIFWTVPLLLAQRLEAAGDFPAALDWYWILYPYDVDAPLSGYDRLNTETLNRPNLSLPPRWTAALDPFTLVTGRPAPYTRYTLLRIIRCLLEYADAEFTRETGESVAHARALYLTARRLLGAAQLRPLQPTNAGEPALAIPDLATLRARADVQLAKLRQGRNIAGMPRAQGLSTALTVSQPTPYRFKTLLERARQLTGQAAQMEAGYLAALEKYDEKNLRLFDATKGIDLSAAQITLAAGRVTEANDAVAAATAQLTKADTMVSRYAAAINAPPNRYEADLLREYDRMRDIRNLIADTDTAIGTMQAASNACSVADEIFSGGGVALFAAGIITATVAKGVFENQQNDLEAQQQANQLKAGLEQRRGEWRLQQAAAQQDALVARAQIVTADDQVRIAELEESIAGLQHDQAVATLKFLNDQFTNADLYQWISSTLGGVYRYFLQQATATARLAQAQLAFERAEPARDLIRNDYWQSPAQLTANSAQPNRRGLTGAEQLSADLTSLDQYAFSSEKRRLNLSRTFSLARLMPVEFLEFRRTGTLSFATPMSLFDQDFPGHYLRMIRQLRTSVVALVPPDRGICASLYSNGISRVTTRQDGAFQDVTVRHDPTVVALSSPVSASGVFDLDAQSDMLLPFESSGVDTTWELQLPPAANPFDFATIVDVMLTIDYTALYDDTYRSQQITRLNANRGRGADRVFSLARDFPDQWYDLLNPADPKARSVTLTLRDADFPLHLDDLVVGPVGVRLSSGEPVPATAVTLSRGATGGVATTTDGMASTRRGNAAAWTALSGTSPAGSWQLAFGADAAALFASGKLDDVQLILGWTGSAPLWTP